METYLKPLDELVRIKDEIDAKISSIEDKVRTNVPFQTLFGVNHETLPQALIADLVDIVPILGEVSGVTRVRLSDSKQRRFLQGLDLAVDAIPVIGPIADILLPANTLMFLDREVKKGR